MFEIGKTYAHSSGQKVVILAKVQSPIWGECLVGEDMETRKFVPISTWEEAFIGWNEVSN